MKAITSSAMAALMLGLAACGASTKTEAAAGDPVTVSLIEKPAISEDMEALPRLAGDSPAITLINADLDRVDAAAVANNAECVATAAENAPDGPGGGMSRSITRPMTGPGYLALRQHFEGSCGGPSPSDHQITVTYDLATGARADWVALLPGLRLVQDPAQPDYPPEYSYSIRSPQLEALYERKMLAEADDAEWREGCRDVWKPKQAGRLGQGFSLWADAEHGAVAIDADYVRAVQACGGAVYLTADEMRAAGAPAALMDALAAAKAAGNWAPREEAEAAE